MMNRPQTILALLVAAALSAGALALADGRGPRTRVLEPADTARVSASIDFFEAKLAGDPHNRTVATRLANRYVARFQQSARLDDLARAQQLALDARPLALDPVSDDARLSGLMLMQHRFSEAYDFAERAVAGDPRRQEALGALFDAALATGRYALVDSLIEQADPQSLPWRVRRARWLDGTGESASAATVMDRVCDRLERAGSPARTRAWCLTELAGMQHGAFGVRAAERTLMRALRVQPGYRGAVEGLADLAHARGEWDRALELYLGIAADAHPDLYLRLAEVSRALSRPDDALGWERKFLETAGGATVEPLFALPLALFLSRDAETIDTALAIVLRDLERRRAVETWDVLAWIHHLRGDDDRALAASDSAMGWGAPSHTMLYHRARILESMGRTAEAARIMEEARSDPTLLEPHVRLQPTPLKQAPHRAGADQNVDPLSSSSNGG